MSSTQFLKMLGSQNYQSLAKPILAELKKDGIKIRPLERHTDTRDEARLEFISRSFDFSDRTSVLDIGANSGFFSIELASRFGCKVFAVEGNVENANFIEASAKILGLEKLVKVQADTHDFEEAAVGYEVILCLNVLHHVGRYFGEAENREEALLKISKYLRGLLRCNQTLVFQMGFNWKGNEAAPFFPSGLKGEMVEFVRDCLPERDYVCDVAVMNPSTLQFESGNSELFEKFHSLGEFGNRPLFVASNKR